jgi:hypothetical protein
MHRMLVKNTLAGNTRFFAALKNNNLCVFGMFLSITGRLYKTIVDS